jgi:hypothetical protein
MPHYQLEQINHTCIPERAHNIDCSLILGYRQAGSQIVHGTKTEVLVSNLISTEQMGFAKRICKKSKFALFDGQTKLFGPFQIH